MYKVFFENRIIFLTEKTKQYLIPTSNCRIIMYENRTQLSDLISNFENNSSEKNYCIQSDNLPVLFAAFRQLFTIVEAAGGVVRNAQGEFLAIIRHGKWDLPKGKIEENEEKPTAALREVEEECGITGVKITHFLTTTFHVYRRNNQRILKPTYWYRMFYKGNEPLQPQTEEGIEALRWLPANEKHTFLSNTYASLAGVVQMEILD